MIGSYYSVWYFPVLIQKLTNLKESHLLKICQPFYPLQYSDTKIVTAEQSETAFLQLKV